MAVLADSRRSPILAGLVVLACALGLVLSCSGTSQAPQIESASEAESSSQNQPPTGTYFITESEATWSVGVDEAPEAPDERLLYLVPTSPIEGFDTDAELRRVNAGGVPKYDERLLYLVPTSPIEGFDTDAELRRVNAGGVPKYDVVVRWPTGLLSVKARPTVECYPLADGRRWRAVEIRGVEGCELTDELGLYTARMGGRHNQGDLHRWMQVIGHDGRSQHRHPTRWRNPVWHSGSVSTSARGSRR